MSRTLRIAVNLLSLTVCVLLLALWVRSHWRDDTVIAGIIGSDQRWIVHSIGGFVAVDLYSSPPYVPPPCPDITNIVHTTQPAAIRNGVPTLWYPHIMPCLWDCQLWMPLWILSLASAMVAAANRFVPDRWYAGRFSLRTLLVATTLLAIALGGMTYWYRPRPPDWQSVTDRRTDSYSSDDLLEIETITDPLESRRDIRQ